MEIVKRLPVILALVFILGALLSISGAIEETGETVREWSPEKMVQATATAQAIPLMNELTRTWIEDVAPTQQAVESEEIVATTKNLYKWQRYVDQAIATAQIAIQSIKVVFSAIVNISLAMCTVGLCIVLICYSIERIKCARAYVPVQRVPDYAWYMPSQKMLGDTRSGIGLLEAPPTAKEHAQTVREFRGVVIRSVVASFFDAVLRRKTSVTQWQPDDRKEIVVR